jgi:hypothetical protein
MTSRMRAGRSKPRVSVCEAVRRGGAKREMERSFASKREDNERTREVGMQANRGKREPAGSVESYMEWVLQVQGLVDGGRESEDTDRRSTAHQQATSALQEMATAGENDDDGRNQLLSLPVVARRKKSRRLKRRDSKQVEPAPGRRSFRGVRVQKRLRVCWS